MTGAAAATGTTGTAGTVAQPGTVGARLRLMRTAHGLTQRALAGPRYTAAYVSSVEAGRRAPSEEALRYFADRLGVSAYELRTGRSADEQIRLDLDLAGADAAADRDPGTADAEYRRIAAAAAASPPRRARCHLGLGHIALRRDDPDAAAAHFAEAHRLLACEPPHLRAEAVAGQAACVRRRGDPRYAAYLLTDVRDELVRSGYPDPGALLTVYVQLAACHSDLGDSDEAASAAAAALALAGLADPAAVADLHLTVARTLLDADRPAAAGTALEQARQARRQAALHPELGWCHQARGRARSRAGDLAGASADLSTAHRVFTAAGHADQAADTAVELAEVYRVLGQPDRAAALLAALAAGTGSGPDGDNGNPDRVRYARAERVRGLLAAGAGDLAAAQRHLRACVRAYQLGGPRHELAAVSGELADLLAAEGRPDEAVRVLREGLVAVQRLTGRPERIPAQPGSAPTP